MLLLVIRYLIYVQFVNKIINRIKYMIGVVTNIVEVYVKNTIQPRHTFIDLFCINILNNNCLLKIIFKY